MRTFICNFLGKLCTTYKFKDGSLIKRSSRESLSYINGNDIIYIDFYYDGVGHYEFHLPKGISQEKASAISEKMNLYCFKKGYIATRRE